MLFGWFRRGGEGKALGLGRRRARRCGGGVVVRRLERRRRTARRVARLAPDRRRASLGGSRQRSAPRDRQFLVRCAFACGSSEKRSSSRRRRACRRSGRPRALSGAASQPLGRGRSPSPPASVLVVGTFAVIRPGESPMPERLASAQGGVAPATLAEPTAAAAGTTLRRPWLSWRTASSCAMPSSIATWRRTSSSPAPRRSASLRPSCAVRPSSPPRADRGPAVMLRAASLADSRLERARARRAGLRPGRAAAAPPCRTTCARGCCAFTRLPAGATSRARSW